MQNSERLDKAFDDAINAPLGEPLKQPTNPNLKQIADGLREIFDNPRLRYRRYEEDDLSWLTNA